MKNFMWHRWMVGVLLLFACAPARVEQQRLADGSWQLTCRFPMDACVREIEKTCKDKRYRILGGQSELRLRDAPPNETEYHTSHLGFVCEVLGTPPPADSANRAGRICASGDTRACVGAAACAGGQACLPEGAGFGPCDCGPTAPSSGDAGRSVGDAGKSIADVGVSDAQLGSR